MTGKAFAVETAKSQDMKNLKLGSIWVIWLIFLSTSLWGQGGLKPAPFNPGLYQSLQWRNVGPFRGGRCVAVTGVPDQPLTYYMGATGGGVWKTDDGGLTWANISDGFFHVGSVGAIAVAPSDPNVLYVGTGEHAVRGVMTSHGDGIYRSENGGKTWAYMGLDSSRHISAIRVHPNNANIVYVAVQGAVYGPATERGVYRSMDGGTTWERVLFINETTGASDLSIDWNNPRILYVGMWDHLRTPWDVRSGGPGSGLYKSIDGGTKWEKLTTGLPLQMGKVGIDVSRANSSVVYANIEADNGGVFRSENGGQTWEHVNNQRTTQARAWYYMEVVADPTNEQSVYILNAPLLRSIDGGRTFMEVANPHTDQHALWINPHNPANMILGNDGGATVTFNGGRSWSAQDNQPTGQFYRVTTDLRFPYHIYGGQQDAMPISIASRTMTDGIGKADWHEVAGGESAFIAFNLEQPDLIYGTSYQGNIEVYDEQTGFRKDVMHYPTVGLAELPRDMKFRFNWNAPLITSPQDSRVLYHAANKVLRSRNGGYDWQVISPDLTRNERDKQGAGGGPYTNEGAGGENYNTISYMAIAPKDMRVIWVGSDDGLVHLSRDEGQTWVNVTPPDLPESIINSIEASPHNTGTAYITAIRYKFNDFSPIIYVTTDYGQTWAKIVRGIAPEDFVRVVREDPKRSGLLYAGTETGLYISTDKGKFWRRFQLNLPVCPINDLTIRDNDLIAATSGRGFWVLDDLSAIQETAGRDLTTDLHLVRPNKPAIRFAMAGSSPSLTQGQNPLPGVMLYYNLPVNYDSIEIKMSIIDENGVIIRRFSNKPQAEYQRYEGGPVPPAQLTSHAGLNRFYWDLRRDPIMHVPGLFVLGDYAAGMVAPGTYTCKLQVGTKKLDQPIRVLPDPRVVQAKDEDYAEQQRLLLSIEANVVEIHQSLKMLRQVRSQMENIKKQLENVDQPDMVVRSERIIGHISDWESKVAQPRQKTYQDAINFPNKLNAAFLDLHARIDSHDPRVTEGAKTRLRELQEYWGVLVSERDDILNKEIEAFNDLYLERQLPPLILPQPQPSNAW